MTDHLHFSTHLTACDFDAKVRDTFLGQAHFAGTGPAGKTCRECRFWHLTGRGGVAVSPGHYAASNKEKSGLIKRALCNYPIPHKAQRRIPHNAKSCSLFEAAEAPFPLRLSGDK